MAFGRGLKSELLGRTEASIVIQIRVQIRSLGGSLDQHNGNQLFARQIPHLAINALAFFGTGTAGLAITEALEESAMVQKNENSGARVPSRLPEYV